jgi:hypothetical protein
MTRYQLGEPAEEMDAGVVGAKVPFGLARPSWKERPRGGHGSQKAILKPIRWEEHQPCMRVQLWNPSPSGPQEAGRQGLIKVFGLTPG